MTLHFRSCGALFAALLVVACSNLRSNAPPEALPSGPLLYYGVETDSGYELRYWSATERTESLFLQLASKPGTLFWDPSTRTVYYTSGSEVYRASYASLTPTPTGIATLPPVAGELIRLWIDTTNGQVRVLFMEEISDNSVSTRKDGAPEYRLADGSIVTGLAEPGWGLPYVAKAFELARGKWTLLSQRGTKWMAGDTPGPSVVGELVAEHGVSQHVLLDTYSCLSGICREEVPGAIADQISESKRGGVALSDFSYLPSASTGTGVVFGTVFGDTLHATPPLFFVTREGAVQALELRTDAQIGLGIEQGYLLIVDEFSGEHPSVIDLGSGDVLFSGTGNGAVWLPLRQPLAME